MVGEVLISCFRHLLQICLHLKRSLSWAFYFAEK
nr:MAG TPA: hypothetical protein [Caudoviricetes sp.]